MPVTLGTEWSMFSYPFLTDPNLSPQKLYLTYPSPKNYT